MPFKSRPDKKARESMPMVTAWIDSLRSAFGKEGIDQAIRSGSSDGTFWAMENGIIIGNPPLEVRQRIEKEWAQQGRESEDKGE